MNTAQELPLRMTVEEAAEYLACQPSTVQTKAAEGKLKGAKIGEGWIFLARDVVAFFQNEIEEQQLKIARKRQLVTPKTEKPKRTAPPSLD